MLIPPSKRKQSRLPLISLIDMTFMLFIFFILVTRFTNLDQIELNIGSEKITKQAGGSKPASDILYLRLMESYVQLGESRVPYAHIGQIVRPYLPGHPVVIEAAEGASVQQMVQVLDAVKISGATDITLKEKP